MARHKKPASKKLTAHPNTSSPGIKSGNGADVSITYFLSDQNSLTVTLNNGSATVVKSTQTVSYPSAKVGDIISVDGTIEGSATIKISVATIPVPRDEYTAGDVHQNFVLV